jgi:hypothetical protein
VGNADDDDTMTPGLGTGPVSYLQGRCLCRSGRGFRTRRNDGGRRRSGGAGRVISFAIDPNFRGWSDGTQRIQGTRCWIRSVAGRASGSHPSAVRHPSAGTDAAGCAEGGRSPLRVAVAREDAALAAATIRSGERVAIGCGSATGSCPGTEPQRSLR